MGCESVLLPTPRLDRAGSFIGEDVKTFSGFGTYNGSEKTATHAKKRLLYNSSCVYVATCE